MTTDLTMVAEALAKIERRFGMLRDERPRSQERIDWWAVQITKFRKGIALITHYLERQIVERREQVYAMYGQSSLRPLDGDISHWMDPAGKLGNLYDLRQQAAELQNKLALGKPS